MSTSGVYRYGVHTSGIQWISQLPDELARQKAILLGLHGLCSQDPDVRWLVIGCSPSRGAGDRYSDLDVAVGVGDAEAAGAADTSAVAQAALRLKPGIDELGELVESFQHQIPGLSTPHERIFAQYADRCQLDLMVFPASVDAGAIPNVVVLYDPSGLVIVKDDASRKRATPELVREWAFLGWCALIDAGKYLRRGSLWEAHDRIHTARTHLWQLHAAVCGVPDPQYGLTSVLDFAPRRVDPALELTVNLLTLPRLLKAARDIAHLLSETADQLPEDLAATFPRAMGAFVEADLRAATLPDERGHAGRQMDRTFRREMR